VGVQRTGILTTKTLFSSNFDESFNTPGLGNQFKIVVTLVKGKFRVYVFVNSTEHRIFKNWFYCLI